jgi:hypothetical protein
MSGGRAAADALLGDRRVLVPRDECPTASHSSTHTSLSAGLSDALSDVARVNMADGFVALRSCSRRDTAFDFGSTRAARARDHCSQPVTLLLASGRTPPLPNSTAQERHLLRTPRKTCCGRVTFSLLIGPFAAAHNVLLFLALKIYIASGAHA